MLNWRNVTPSSNPKYWVRGTVIECATAGAHSRYLIESVRYYLDGTFYRVRDAERVTDAAVRAGENAPIVFTADTLDRVEKWLVANG